MLTDDGYRQLMKHAKRLAQEGHGELAQHLRDAIDLRAEVEALKTNLDDLNADRENLRMFVSKGMHDGALDALQIVKLSADVASLRADADRLDCGQIMIDTRDEFGEPKQVWHTGMNLRAAIDAARAAQGGE